jgi:fatty-acyl-CoA synthase
MPALLNPETLEEVPHGESGEIVMHGPQIFNGYWKRPDATEAALLLTWMESAFSARAIQVGVSEEMDIVFVARSISERRDRMLLACEVWPAGVEGFDVRTPSDSRGLRCCSTRDALPR